MTAFTVLGLDPGTQHLGWALLEAPATLRHYGTLRPRTLTEHEALDELYLMARKLVSRYRPDVVVVEEYVWQGNQRRAKNRPAMQRLLGMLQTLRWHCPYCPALVLIAPQVWMAQLCGPGQTPKTRIAQVVQYRLGATIVEKRNTRYGNHATDAAGCALAWLDHHQLERSAV